MLVYNNFEWDVSEAASCLARHGVTFKEASTVFASEDVIITDDPTSGCLRAVGPSARGRTLVVLHQRGARIRILGATLQSKKVVKAQAPEPEVTTPPAKEPAAPAPERARDERAEPAADSASHGGAESGNGWTAEAYGLYWDAYTAAREAAKREGKSPREAQRLAKKAGELAAFGREAPTSKPPASEVRPSAGPSIKPVVRRSA